MKQGAVVACAVQGGHAHMLRREVDCWVASADEIGNAHLVPLSVPSTMRSRTVFGT